MSLKNSGLDERAVRDTTRLPNTNEAFFGRVQELKSLTRAWNNRKLGVAAITSFGGRGKSALVRQWIKRNGLPRARFVLGWSFYRQGTNERDSADEFSEWLFNKLGYRSNELSSSRWERGQIVAEHMKKLRGLLVLDGLEPLQDQAGNLRDEFLRSLLTGLIEANAGLAIVTSRIPLADFTGKMGVEHIPLHQLDRESGKKLLKSLDVHGTAKELGEAVREFQGHPLALRLLGGFIREQFKGDIRRRHEIDSYHQSESGDSKHADRILTAYDKLFFGQLEQSLLYLLGLFDHAATIDGLRAVLDAENSQSTGKINLRLAGIGSPSWNAVCGRLTRLGLLSASVDHVETTFDTHPVIRAFFGTRFRETSPKGWRVAHSRLFIHFATTSPEFPDSLSGGLANLYAAVRHGCLSRDHPQAFALYWSRILRGTTYYSTYKICAFTLELSTLKGFFTQPWNRFERSLSPEIRAQILSQVGYCLRAIGSLEEALDPLEHSSRAFADLRLFKEAAISQGNHARTLLPLGQLRSAEESARRAVALADNAGYPDERADKRSVLADILHHLGDSGAAGALFDEAEALADGNLPGFAGLRYCEFLISIGELQDAFLRAIAISKVADVGERSHLLYGLATIYASAACQSASRLQMSDDAIHSIRRSGRNDYLAYALSLRIRLLCAEGRFDRAIVDFEEGVALAKRHKCAVYLADLLFEAMNIRDLKGLAQRRIELGKLAARIQYGRLSHSAS